jgi:hypothetical protein
MVVDQIFLRLRAISDLQVGVSPAVIFSMMLTEIKLKDNNTKHKCSKKEVFIKKCNARTKCKPVQTVLPACLVLAANRCGV